MRTIIYDDVQLLPDSVKAALDETEQSQWMNAFNSMIKKSKTKATYREAVLKAWESLKESPNCRFFSGFVSTQDLDKQNDIVLSDMALEKIRKHIERGGTMIDTHSNRTVGSFFYADKRIAKSGKPGIYAYGVIYKGEPYFDNAWELIKKGIDCPSCNDARTGFSIGGFAIDTKTSCDAHGCHREITDMSIHEISICQMPANPNAMIKQVNMMAKSETEMDNMENEINKALREDSPAVDEGIPSPVQDESAQMGQNVPNTAVPQVDENGQPVKNDGKNELKAVLDKIKMLGTDYQDMVKLKEALASTLAEINSGNLINPPTDGAMAKGANCECMDHDVHTPMNSKKCPENKELNGDVKDPQVKDSMESFEVKDIKPEKYKTDNDNDLMPGKPEMKGVKFEKGPEGPATESSTTKIKGFSNLKAKNASEDKIEIPKEHLKEDTEEAKDIKDASNEIEDTADEIIEDDKKEIEKGCSCGKMTAEQFKAKYAPKAPKTSIKDNGKNGEKNFGKEGKEAMQKSEEDYIEHSGPMGGEMEENNEPEEESDNVEIPADLYPLFQEFLQSKGIKVEPPIGTEEIEGPIQKTLYLDDDISEMDLKILLHNNELFKSAEALGRMKMTDLRVRNLNDTLSLEPDSEVFHLSFLIPSDIKKGYEDGPINNPMANKKPVNKPVNPKKPMNVKEYQPNMEDEQRKIDFKNDFEDRDLMEAKYDMSDPDSDASIDAEMARESQRDGEHEFWNEVDYNKRTMAPRDYIKWVNGLRLKPEYYQQVMNYKPE